MPQVQGSYAQSGAIWYNSAAAEETKSIVAGPGLVFAIAVTNSNAAIRFLYLFDSLTATGTLILPPIQIAAGISQRILDMTMGIPFSIGLFAAASSTNATYTASATADFRMAFLTKG